MIINLFLAAICIYNLQCCGVLTLDVCYGKVDPTKSLFPLHHSPD